MGLPEIATAPAAETGAMNFADTASPLGWRRSTSLLLGAVLVVAVGVRFSTLGLQSYWSDEAATVHLLKGSFGHMLSALPDSERTPPLYYAAAWVWSRLFGTGEVGLRSLSAIFGVVTVLVAYLIARRVAGQGAGLIAALLCAVSPLLVWYSQEARAYALAVLLCALSLWFFVRALTDPQPRVLRAWGVSSGLAICAHYFALFAVALEASFLLASRRSRRPVVAPAAAVGCVAMALLPRW